MLRIKMLAFIAGATSLFGFVLIIVVDAVIPETEAGRYARMILEFPLWPGGVTSKFGIYIGIGWKLLIVAVLLIRKTSFFR